MANFNTDLGIRPDGDGRVVLDAEARHQVAPGLIHFAVLTTIAEVAAAASVGAAVVPASLTVNLMAPAKPGRVQGRGTLLRRGRRLAVAEGEVTQDGKLVAKAVVTFAVMEA